MQAYVDPMVAEKSKVPKRRKFVHDRENFYNKEKSGPRNAPKWTITKYKGHLKDLIRNTLDDAGGNNQQAGGPF